MPRVVQNKIWQKRISQSLTKHLRRRRCGKHLRSGRQIRQSHHSHSESFPDPIEERRKSGCLTERNIQRWRTQQCGDQLNVILKTARNRASRKRSHLTTRKSASRFGRPSGPTDIGSSSCLEDRRLLSASGYSVPRLTLNRQFSISLRPPPVCNLTISKVDNAGGSSITLLVGNVNPRPAAHVHHRYSQYRHGCGYRHLNYRPDSG